MKNQDNAKFIRTGDSIDIIVSPTIPEKYTLCYGCIVENSLKIKYLNNFEIDNDEIPKLLIKYKFDGDHEPSKEFIKFFKSIKLPRVTYDEFK